jgi:hypothetical protein
LLNLVTVQCQSFPGCRGENHAVNRFGGIMAQQAMQRWFIQAIVAEGRDQRQP